MSFTKEEIEKLYNLKEKLFITYKAATSAEMKKSLAKNLREVESVISDIEEGRPVDLQKLNIFSDALKRETDMSVEVDEYDDSGINYAAKVELLKLSDKNRDHEMDEIYSFMNYLDTNFLIPTGASYLKLDYYLSKKRDTVYSHYESLKMLLKEYVDDLDVLFNLRFTEQIEQYKSRLGQQKKYFLIKISEVLHELKKFIHEILSDYDSGRKSIFNPDEKYMSKFGLESKTEFDGVELITIVREFEYFIDDFIEILRMPNFKRNV